MEMSSEESPALLGAYPLATPGLTLLTEEDCAELPVRCAPTGRRIHPNET